MSTTKSSIIAFMFSFFFSCNSGINNDENEIISENSFLSISTTNNRSEVSGLENIYINVKNFTNIWKIYLVITNNQSIAFEDRILLNITSSSDSIIYQTIWDTNLFPNGNYDLYAEVIDSTNQRIISTKSFTIMNYNTLKIINNHESSINYLINSDSGIIFSNSTAHLQIEKISNGTNLKCDIQELPCGTTFSYNFFITPGNIDQPIIIAPDSNSFFLRIQNKSLEENSINSVLIQANDNIEECNNLSIQNDNQVYSLGYFNLNNDLYQQGKVEILTRYGSNSDTTKLTFFNESILIDTLTID
ncbi:MAG: hypothetical protein ACJZ11_03205 [Candidatus Neomarinimicrobiota bacterium]